MIYQGDCRVVLPFLADNSVDAIVTDPPYGLEFMGEEWDAPWRQTSGGFSTPGIGERERAWPSYKGSNLSRCETCGRLVGQGGSPCVCESPRPKRSDAERMRAFQAWAEAIFVECMRVLKPGGHLLAFGGSRTYHRMACAVEDAGFEVRDQIMWVYGSGFPKSHNGEWGGTALKPAHEPIVLARKPLIGTVEANWRTHGTGALNIDGCRVGADATGRWPANLIHDGSDEVLAAFPDAPGQRGVTGTRTQGACFTSVNAGQAREQPRGDTGNAARFFYCAKASKADRGEGNVHPTVKPTELMRYLCRLITPPGGTVLDPFMGSGTTGKAAALEGFQFIGIELNPEYVALAKRRAA